MKSKNILRFLSWIGEKSCIFAVETQKIDALMSNIIRNIRIGGITNIAEVSVPLEALTALVAPNNYGKSNVLQGVEFAVRFLTATPQERRGMMAQRKLIPINQSMDNRPFEFEISGTAAGYDYEYGRSEERRVGKEC